MQKSFTTFSRRIRKRNTKGCNFLCGAMSGADDVGGGIRDGSIFGCQGGSSNCRMAFILDINNALILYYVLLGSRFEYGGESYPRDKGENTFFCRITVFITLQGIVDEETRYLLLFKIYENVVT